jgi:CHAD domain-containing protein
MDIRQLLAVFDERVAIYETHLLACSEAFGVSAMDEDAVHDLRVAIRRLLALLDVLRSDGFGLRARKLRRSLKRQLSSLGALRDTHVMLKRLGAVNGLLPIREKLRLREKALQRRSGRTVAGIDVPRQRRRLGRLRNKLAAWQGDIDHAMLIALGQMSEKVLARHARVLSEQSGSHLLDRLHRERIAFKRFRYTVEIVHLLQPFCAPAEMEALRSYQTLLGDIQDARVMLHVLEDAMVVVPARV